MVDFYLLELVRSLEPSEIRQVYQYAGQAKRPSKRKGGDETPSLYLQLFGALTNFSPHSEDEFKQQVKDEEFMVNYAFNKSYLQQMILDAMRSFRRRGSKDKPAVVRAREMLEDALFLRKKLQFKLAWKMLKKAKKVAEEIELHESLLEILRTERRFLMEGQQLKDWVLLGKRLAEMREVAETVAMKYEMLEQRDLLFSQSRKSARPRGQESIDFLTQFKQHPLIKSIPRTSCFDIRINHHLCRALIHQLEGNINASWRHHLVIFRLWQGKPLLREERSLDFIAAVNNFLSLSLATENLTHFPEAIKLLQEGPFPSPLEKSEALQGELYNRLQYALLLSDWEAGEEVIRKFHRHKKIIAAMALPSRITAFYHSFVNIYFLQGKYKLAAKWNNRLLETATSGVRQDLILSARLVQVVISYQLGDVEGLDNHLRQLDYHLEKVNGKRRFEHLLLEFLEQMKKRQGLSDAEHAFQHLHASMEDLKNDPDEHRATGLDLVLHWLRSH